jgi:3-oxo-5-alpha-steroid 4-dehydrogenase 1
MFEFQPTPTLYNISVALVAVFTCVSWLSARVIKVINYGRLKGSLFAIEFPPRIAWCLMELPNLFWVVYFTVGEGIPLGLGYCLFLLHYLNRTLIYPFTLKTSTKLPVEIVVSALCFTCANGYIQGINNWKIQAGQAVDIGLRGCGCVLFTVGMFVNVKADRMLQEAKGKMGITRDLTLITPTI